MQHVLTVERQVHDLEVAAIMVVEIEALVVRAELEGPRARLGEVAEGGAGRVGRHCAAPHVTRGGGKERDHVAVAGVLSAVDLDLEDVRWRRRGVERDRDDVPDARACLAQLQRVAGRVGARVRVEAAVQRREVVAAGVAPGARRVEVAELDAIQLDDHAAARRVARLAVHDGERRVPLRQRDADRALPCVRALHTDTQRRERA